MYNFCFQNTNGPDSLPDPSLPLAHQLEFALSKISEHVRTIGNMTATCKRLDEVCFSFPIYTVLISLGAKAVVSACTQHMQRLKEKEDALTKAERSIVSRDKVINELRLRLPAAASRERLLADVAMQQESDIEIALKMAQQTIRDLQERLEKKEDVLKKYHNQLTEARQVPHPSHVTVDLLVFDQ